MSDASNIPATENGAKSAKAVKKDAEETPKSKKEAFFDEVKFFVGMFAFILTFHTFIFGHYKIPSESMQPALEVGDHLYVSKFAYGYSKHSLPFGIDKLPFWPKGKIMSRVPERGDVVVFRNPRSGIVMIKRALGLPGDEIVVSRGQFYINGERVERIPVESFTYRADNGRRKFTDRVRGRNKYHQRWGNKISVTEYTEQWPGEDKPHHIYEISDMENLDNVRPMTVPEGTIFFLGDNRDRSLDSRADSGPGFVPFDYLIGRADMMMFSFKKCEIEEGIKCPPRRFMKRL